MNPTGLADAAEGRRSRSVLECGGAPPLSQPDGAANVVQSAGGPAQSKTWRNIVAVMVFLAATMSVAAQTYSIPWSKIAGGGGTSTGGVYSVSGTIGQHDAGTTMTNGPYALTGGFWSLVQVVQTPGAPVLRITLTTTNTALILWPSPSTDFVLQQTADLGSPDWGATPTPTPNDNGTTRWIVVDPPAGQRFYRLFKP